MKKEHEKTTELLKEQHDKTTELLKESVHRACYGIICKKILEQTEKNEGTAERKRMEPANRKDIIEVVKQQNEKVVASICQLLEEVQEYNGVYRKQCQHQQQQ